MDRCTHELLEAADVIGGVLEVPHWVTAGLVSAIEQTGRSIGDLTVEELVGLIRNQQNRINVTLRGTEY